MSVPDMPTLPWIRERGRTPKCDVPWLGYSMVQADGELNFCCFTSASAGNIRNSSFEAVWNGPVMQRIRSSLVDGQLPAECQTSSCPIFRGDDRHYILDRMGGDRRWEPREPGDPRGALALSLAHAELVAARQENHTLRVTMRFPALADEARVDLFVCVQAPDATLSFLPIGTAVPTPFRVALELGAHPEQQTLELWHGTLAGVPPGTYTVVAACFEPDTDPNLLRNCLAVVRTEVSVTKDAP